MVHSSGVQISFPPYDPQAKSCTQEMTFPVYFECVRIRDILPNYYHVGVRVLRQ